MKKVIFISSAGGHFCELMQLDTLFKSYESYVITEKEKSTIDVRLPNVVKIYYLLSARRNNILLFALKNICNLLRSLFLFILIYPDVIVTTGANTAVPICYFGKLFRKKIIYRDLCCESFENFIWKISLSYCRCFFSTMEFYA